MELADRREEWSLPKCPGCGTRLRSFPELKLWPWRISRKADLLAFVHGLGDEAHEWLLAFYLADDFRLIGIETVARGDTFSAPVDHGKLICRGRQLGAASFILVHNHPSGNARPSQADIATTAKLARLADDLGLVLLDHLIVTGDDVVRVGHF